MKTHRIIHPLITIFALLFFLAGCKEDEYSLRFSHYLHVEDNGMDCSDCHGELGEFKPVSHETCLDCHDEPDAEEITVETCGMCHQKKQLPQLKKQEEYAVEQSIGRNIFVHTEALDGKCMDCHGNLLDKNLKLAPKLTRADVLQIRNKAHASRQDCNTCHVDMAPNQAPSSHDMVWMKRHGLFGMQDDAACSVCHTEDTCKDCHSVMQPASHNNLWRLKTHGVEASWDRQSCSVCHQEDSCVACHKQTQPRSHRARWAASGKYPTHCISCHTDSMAGEGCVVCHEEGNNVLLHESFWPDSHNLLGDTANCYQCHTFDKF